MSTAAPPANRGRLTLLGTSGPGTADPMVVGAKAAGLLRMADAGLSVPPGFVLGTSVSADYRSAGRRLPEDVDDLLERGMRSVEQATGRQFGSPRRPLLVSVRSGAPASMPGMLDTVLDVGLCDLTLDGLVRVSGDPGFAWGSYRRLVRSYAEVVEGCPVAPFASALEEALAAHEVPDAGELDVAANRTLVARFLDLYRVLAGRTFPQDPAEQLRGAVEAVLRSWDSPRAVEYRRLEGLTGLPGTAVTVQAMVFGTLGVASGAGVGFTRDPATGRNELYVDFLLDAEGEDVVAGRRAAGEPSAAIAAVPGLAERLASVRRTLEATFGDVQDFEFTVEDGTLWLLQTRTAKRTPLAALQTACDLVDEGIIDPATAVERLRPYDLDQITRVTLSAAPGVVPLCRATPASTGVASGRVVLDVEAAVAAAAAGDPVVLVRRDASTEDLAALVVARGLLTAEGARTSHAAVVARQLGVVCLVGCRELDVDLETRTLVLGETRLAEGDAVTLDATTGAVYAGSLELMHERPVELLERVRGWERELPGRPAGRATGTCS
jgi:pyruvate, orthophosphate dikinase